MTGYCVIISGRLPGDKDDAAVWAPIATAFKLSDERFKAHVLARLPMVVKKNIDEPAARSMVEQLRASLVDATAEPDHTDHVNLVRDGRECGPLPFPSLSKFARHGERYRSVGSSDWKTWNGDSSATPALGMGEFDICIEAHENRVAAPLPISPTPALRPQHTETPPPLPAAMRARENALKPAGNYGLFLLAAPVAALVVSLVWGHADVVTFAAIICTAIIAASEANQSGLVHDRKKGVYKPYQWFFILWLIWPIGFPYYLYKRKYFGLPNLSVWGIVATLALIFGPALLSTMIDTQHGSSIASASSISSANGDAQSSHPSQVAPQPPIMTDAEIRDCELRANIIVRSTIPLAQVYGRQYAEQKASQRIEATLSPACRDRIAREWTSQ